jgi:PTS system nitrogen regulatory IIA component
MLRPVLRAHTKAEAIEELLEVLHRAGGVADLAAAREAVWAREQSLSTGLEHGLAVPHGRTDAVRELVCAIGLSLEGIPFDSSDGEPARIVVLTLSPLSQPTPHVQLIARISQVLNAEGRTLMLACHTAEEMAALLTGDLRNRENRLLGELRRRLTGAQAPSLAAQFLHSGLVIPELNARDACDAIVELVERAEAKGVLRDAAAVRLAVLNREQQGSTALGHGLAIPHARTDAVDRLICVIGRSARGIAFEAPDGAPVRIVVLMVCPVSAAEPQVRLMAQLSRALDAAGRERFLAAPSAEAMLQILGA